MIRAAVVTGAPSWETGSGWTTIILEREVFICSTATRVSYGGIAPCAHGIATLRGAFGKDVILVETLGLGQADCAVADIADVVVLVVSPESADAAQFMKTGIVEIADIVVVNKTDLANADGVTGALRHTLALRTQRDKGGVPVLPIQALNDYGVEDLFRELDRHTGDMGKTVYDPMDKTACRAVVKA